jgi:hypothetical protein
MKNTVFDVRKANTMKIFVLFFIDALDFADCRELPIVCMSYVSTALCLLGSSVAPLAITTSDFVANYPRRQCWRGDVGDLVNPIDCVDGGAGFWEISVQEAPASKITFELIGHEVIYCIFIPVKQLAFRIILALAPTLTSTCISIHQPRHGVSFSRHQQCTLYSIAAIIKCFMLSFVVYQQ